MLELYKQTPQDTHLPPISEEELSDQEVLEEIVQLKEELQDQVVVLGHHYQVDDIIRFADITGDSLALAQKARQIKKPYIIFCGVHFMAETADMLSDNQTVLLPDLRAGCSMADMANAFDVAQFWDYLKAITSDKIIPVTYVNSSATLKAFVGAHEGYICTSSNAEKVIKTALEKGQKLLFVPDQHLGRNSCYFKLGIALDKMVTYNPHFPHGGLKEEQIQNAKVILWHGYCSVHQGFQTAHIEQFRKNEPDTKIIVHPECSFDVVRLADYNGSTQQIIEMIKKSPAGSSWAVGTEINLVNRLGKMFPDKKICSLSPYQCLCTTMYRVRPRWLLECFRSIVRGQPAHIVHVSDEIKQPALLALERMLALS